MIRKTFIPETGSFPASQIGATLEALSATIATRRDAKAPSYTHQLLTDHEDMVLKKVMEEAGEVALAAKDVEHAIARTSSPISESVQAHKRARVPLEQDDPAVSAAVDHIRYEAADVVYHLLVVLERFDISLDEFAAELNNRMTDAERPVGGVQLFDEYVKRGK